MAYRIWARVDGGVSITPRDPSLTAGRWAAQLAKLATAPHLVDAAPIDVTDAALTPDPDGLDRRFRSAWRWSGGAVVHDIHACRVLRMREIHVEIDRRDEYAHIRAHTEGDPRWQGYRTQLHSLNCDVSNLTTAAAIAAYEPSWPQEPQ